MKTEWTPETEANGDADIGGGTLKEIGVGEIMGKSGEKLDVKEEEEVEQGETDKRKSGLSYGMAAFFMVAQMAGAGFLSLPKAVANASWGGAFMIFFFCVSVAFSASRLGMCWSILEERWEEYRKPARQPYMEIASRALGVHGRRITLFSVLFTQIGSTIVFIILIAGFMNNFVPSLSQCLWSLIVTAVLLPIVFLGSPKDFWQASVLAVLSTVVAIIVIDVEMLIQSAKFLAANPVHSIPTISTFSLGFGAILFSYGGSSVFPTIQNDMKDRREFWKSVIISFSTIFLLYFPVGVIGYMLLGDSVKDNILLSIGSSTILTVAVSLQIINLAGTFIISLNPCLQAIEDIIGIPTNFCWQRIAVRTSVILFELIVVLAVPDFGLILNLIGGSTMSCMSFILPPIMYMKLVADKSDKTWPERSIPLWQRAYLWLILVMGIIGGISATVSAILAIAQPSAFKKSCFVNFYGSTSNSTNT
ncbi:UNVERIFIED_CONTAM: hypothetical protein RMT77_006724 [Armadillidium vulgare]